MRREEEYIDRVLGSMPLATPMRSQIATELRGHIAERIAHGHSLDEVLRQLGDPVILAESYLAAIPLVSAPLWRRAVAKLLDVFTIVGVLLPVAWFAWHYQPEGFFGIVVLLLGSLLFGTYTVVAECWTGQTLGKRLVGIRTVRESGARVSIGQAVVRQLPIFLQVFAIDALFALFTERSQRAFELLSKTRVVLAVPEEAR